MKQTLIVLGILFPFQAFSQMPTKLDTIVKTEQPPYNKICFLHVYRHGIHGGSWYASTGFFIAPNIILTAAHNIHTVWGSKVSAIEIVPGKYYEHYPYDSIEIKGENNCDNAIRTHPNYKFSNRQSERIKWDFGIIIIPEKKLEDSPKIGRDQEFVLDSMFTLRQGDILNVAGYPADPAYGYDGDFITFQQDKCGQVSTKTFSHQLDTYTGNSGSPILGK
jgi:V8-like Glu-specific endopeptidase